MYDYLIIGGGLFGSVFAHEMSKLKRKCLIIEKRTHIGGNCYTENRSGINVHMYGPHIFHTSNKIIWDWIGQFSKFNNFKNNPKVFYENKIYSFPINLLTLHQLWGVNSPEEASNKLNSVKIKINNPQNLEEWAISEVGMELYNIFIKGYTQKQWNISPNKLPSSIIKRLPIRLSFDDDYFFDKYQGIPINGYTNIFRNMLIGIDVKLNTNYFDNQKKWDSVANKVVYTGKIDEFFNYKYGRLEYRSLNFLHTKLNIKDYQGCAIINYTDYKVPYTRIIEHKHFENLLSNETWITKEYPTNHNKNNDAFYPINNNKNNEIYSKYKKLTNKYPNVIFGGRLAEYKYFDMHHIIENALEISKNETS